MSNNKNIFGDKIFDITNYTLLIFITLLFVYPLWFIVIASISDPNAIWAGKVLVVPVGFSLAGYKRVFEYHDVWSGYANTIFYTVLGTALNLFVTFTAAYPLARKEFMLRGFLMKLYTFTMYFSGGMIPVYLLIKQLGLINTRWVLILPGAVAVWNLIITRTFIQSNMPVELYDAAAIDGISNFGMLWKIVLPLSTPIIAVMALFYGVEHWNQYFSALIYLSDKNLFPLQLVLRNILISSQISFDMAGVDTQQAMELQKIAEILKYALIIVATLPVLCVYPFIQKYFAKGIMVGSLKG